MRKITENTEDIEIAICALMETWHGYERLIMGLADYYKIGGKRKIRLHFIGDGTEISKYKKLVDENALSEHVVFYGRCRWDEIPLIYNRCNLAASSLGVYKVGIEYLCALKMREYLAAGLPFIGAGQLDVMEYEDLRQYVKCFSNDPSIISMEQVINFFDGLYRNKSYQEMVEMSADIRNKAEEHFNMNRAMQNVVDYINCVKFIETENER